MRFEASSSELEALQRIVGQFYRRLADISGEHEELTDTDVREHLHEALNHYFVWGNPIEPLPCHYGMFSVQGNREVSEAVRCFLEAACPLADEAELSPGRERLDVLQDSDFEYDMFIGHVDSPLPDEPLHPMMFEPPEEEDFPDG